MDGGSYEPIVVSVTKFSWGSTTTRSGI